MGGRSTVPWLVQENISKRNSTLETSAKNADLRWPRLSPDTCSDPRGQGQQCNHSSGLVSLPTSKTVMTTAAARGCENPQWTDSKEIIFRTAKEILPTIIHSRTDKGRL